MRVLFDQGTPVPLRAALVGHTVETAYERGWSERKNGELLAAAEAEAFEVVVTTDKNLKYQQRLAGRNFGLVVLLTTSWPRISAGVGKVVRAVDEATPGSYVEIPFEAGA